MGKYLRRTAQCANCKEPFILPQRGRPPACCSESCTKARRASRKNAASIEHDEWLMRAIAMLKQELQHLEQSIVEGRPDSDGMALLGQVERMQRLFSLLTAVAVTRARSSSTATWATIGQLFGLSRTTASRRWAPRRVERQLYTVLDPPTSDSEQAAPTRDGETPPPSPGRPTQQPPEAPTPPSVRLTTDVRGAPRTDRLDQSIFMHCYFPTPLDCWPDTSTAQDHSAAGSVWQYSQYFPADRLHRQPPHPTWPGIGGEPGLPLL